MSVLIKLKETKNFTENERSVAKYIIENFRDIKNINIYKIKDETFTTMSTITRTFKKIGLKGFLEFKIALIEELGRLEEDYAYEKTELGNMKDVKSIINRLYDISKKTLIENIVFQNEEIINKVVKIISEKKVIDFYGVGEANIICRDAQYKFMRLQKLTNFFEEVNKQYVQATNSDNDHLGIIISYSGETKEMLEIANILSEKGVETISITGYNNNELSKKTSNSLYVSSREALNSRVAIYSRTAMFNLIDILYFSYSNMQINEMLNKDDKINKKETEK